MFPYIGGKSQHIRWMDPEFPSVQGKFIDVFGGAGWVSVRSQKITQAQTRVYNDYNALLANVYECFRSDPERLLALMRNIPESQYDLYAEYQTELFQHKPQVNLGDFCLAVKYLYLQTQIFSGTPLNATNVPYFVDLKTQGRYQSKWITLQRKLQKPQIQARLRAIDLVENLDCIDSILKHDAPDSFFYVDPPYYRHEHYYSQDFPRDRHELLAQTLRNISGRFALSYYEFPELQHWYSKSEYRWHVQSVYKNATTRQLRSDNRAEEILIMNYDPHTLKT